MPETRKLIAAEFRRERIIICVATVFLAVLAIAGGWAGDYRSCQRQAVVRTFLIQDREINRQAAVYWRDHGRPEIAERIEARIRAERTIRQLDCLRPLPGG